MWIKTIPVGPLEGNCIIVADEVTGDCMIIDPGDEPDLIMETVKINGFNVLYIVCTHGHFDHVGCVGDIKKETNAKIVIHKEELEIYNKAKEMASFWGFDIDPLPEPDIKVSEGDLLKLGDLSFEILHTPGHSPGGICLYTKGLVITGDTLFAGSVGRTDLYGGDTSKLRDSFRRLLKLPEDTKVISGHGPATTIGREKRFNMFSFSWL
ncbi:MAG: MBL fold metallo-hydrolase [Thermodesulfovibrionales bacterium]|nr:MBL fold metallo-hydrolase [Thermodesulfovibrionales bacterium]